MKWLNSGILLCQRKKKAKSVRSCLLRSRADTFRLVLIRLDGFSDDVRLVAVRLADLCTR